jgi:pimeloyl-ACP methyl ester carboxylesterase
MTTTVTSADGTALAFDQVGEGPPVVMVVGAFNTRATTGPLASALQDRFTIFNYDRRGRGESSDTPPYAVERELEDLDALIAEAGGSAAVFGYSSGANLALQAAAPGLRRDDHRRPHAPDRADRVDRDADPRDRRRE